MYLVENELAEHVKKNVPFFNDSKRIDNCLIEGYLLKNSYYTSVFNEDSKLLPLIEGEHVGSKQGTGLVHTAPALG